MTRRFNAVIGAVTLVVFAVAGFGLVRFLSGSFKSGYEITATFARAGQLLRSGSDVKMRGVLVGEVKRVDIARDGRARVTMRMFPNQPIPETVDAAIRAKTLFGEKFIALSASAQRSSRTLHAGSEIPESRTTPPIEVETVLSRAVPVLNAIDPEQFAGALHALAQSFVGNTEELRRATVQGERLLTSTERTLPNLERNLVHLRHFASALDASDTDLLRALDGLTAVGDVIRSHPREFDATVRDLVPLATDLGDVFTARQRDLADLAGKGRAVLDEVSERADKLPNLVKVLDGFLGVWIADLSVGPNWRIFVTSEPASGHPYPPGQEPRPQRARAMERIVPDASPGRSLADILLAPVPTETLRRMGGQRPVTAVLPILTTP